MIELVSGSFYKISPSAPKEPSGISPLPFPLPSLPLTSPSLRFSFVNVGVSASPTSNGPSGSVAMTGVNTGKAPVLAACFSEVFTVYSAKRFPGVVESTNLSKCFATQGIKIPIRKDGPGKGDKEKDDDDF
jgi:Velvet factor